MDENNKIPGFDKPEELSSFSSGEKEAQAPAVNDDSFIPAGDEFAAEQNTPATAPNEAAPAGPSADAASSWQNPWETPARAPEAEEDPLPPQADEAPAQSALYGDTPEEPKTEAPGMREPAPPPSYTPPQAPYFGGTPYAGQGSYRPQYPYPYQQQRPQAPYGQYGANPYYYNSQPPQGTTPPAPEHPTAPQQTGQINWNASEYHGVPQHKDMEAPNTEPPKDEYFSMPYEPRADVYGGGPMNKPPKKKMRGGLKVFLGIIGVLFAGFILAFCGYGIYSAIEGGVPFDNSTSSQMPGNDNSQATPGGDSSSSTQSPTDPNASVPIEDVPSGDQKTAKEIYDQAKQSVVGIVIYDKNADLAEGALSQGSGVVVTENGYIMTNAHVINNSKEYKVKVVLSNDEEYDAQVVGFDTRTDLAVVKIDKTGLVPATFGNSDQLAVGDWVLAIGNPGGLDFSSSLTRGIVSAVNRTVGTDTTVKYIQTDAAINPGNSGGALLNMYGQVIGINTAKIKDTAYEGMAFSIPINTAKTIVDDLIKSGYVTGRMRLGMSVRMLSEYEAQMHGVPVGLLIAEITADSDLINQGVQVEDIITKVNGKDITSLNVLYEELEKCKPGDTVNLTIYRMGSRAGQDKTFSVDVKVTEDKGQ